jgi:predicted transcriptional regulator
MRGASVILYEESHLLRVKGARRTMQRSKSDIISSILQSTYGYPGTSITQILHETGVSYKRLKQFLIVLIQSKCIAYSKEGKTFRITESGMHTLKLYQQMNELLE